MEILEEKDTITKAKDSIKMVNGFRYVESEDSGDLY